MATCLTVFIISVFQAYFYHEIWLITRFSLIWHNGSTQNTQNPVGLACLVFCLAQIILFYVAQNQSIALVVASLGLSLPTVVSKKVSVGVGIAWFSSVLSCILRLTDSPSPHITKSEHPCYVRGFKTVLIRCWQSWCSMSSKCSYRRKTFLFWLALLLLLWW